MSDAEPVAPLKLTYDPSSDGFFVERLDGSSEPACFAKSKRTLFDHVADWFYKARGIEGPDGKVPK